MWVGDLEANGLLDTATKIHCGVFKNVETGEIKKFTPKNVMEIPKFLDTVDHLCMHNGIGYDLPLLRNLYDYDYTGEFTDTLILSRLYEPNRMRPFGMKGKAGPHSVESWGYRLGRGKPEHEDWSKFSPEMLHRCTEDVEIQHRIYLALEKEAEGYNYSFASRLNHKLFTVLQMQEAYGWLVDQDHLERSIRVLTKWMKRIDRSITPRLPMVIEINESKKGNWIKSPFLKSAKLNSYLTKYWEEDSHLVGGPHTRISFRPVSLDSNNETKEYLLNLGWIPKDWNVNKDTGERTSPKMSKDDPFEGIQGSLGRLVAKRVQCKQRRAILEGWKKAIRPDGRLPGRVTGLAATGRATHSCIVNVPGVEAFFGKWMRKVFTVPSGRKLIGCDAGSCQDRMLAQRAKNQNFTDMLLHGDKSKGTDGHSLAMKGVNKALDKHNLSHISRGKAKNFNFGWKFGAQDPKLGGMVGGGKDVGASIRKELENVFPAQAELVDKLTQEWKSNATQTKGRWGDVRYKDGWITGLDGRPIFISSEHMILVYMLQSDEAICMAGAYTMLYNRLIKKGYKWGEDWAYVCWYHDEYTIECREELVDEIKPMAEQAIVDAGKYFGLTHCA